MATNSDGGGEKFQIAILTFFMTAGGFLILTLVFALYVNPGQDTRRKKAEKDYVELCALLQKEEMRRFRQQDRVNKEKGEERDLRMIISENLSNYGIEYREFRSPKKSPKKGGVTEVTQPLALKPASMTPILQFIASVKHARKSVQVESLELTRKATEDEDSWQASVVFVDYETAPSP